MLTKEEIEQHISSSELSTTIDLVNRLRETDVIEAENSIYLERFFTITNYLQSMFLKSDPYFLTSIRLDEIYKILYVINTNIREYNQSKNSQYLITSNDYFDSLVNIIGMLYLPPNFDDTELLRDSVISYRQSLSQHLRYANEEIKKLKDEVYNLSDHINNLSTNFRVDIINYQDQLNLNTTKILNLENEREVTFNSSEQLRENRFKDKLSTYEELMDSKNQEFLTQIKSNEKHFNTVITEQQNRFNTLINEFINKAKLTTDSLEKSQTQAKNILGTLSVDSHAAGYQKEANKAGKNKVIWQYITGFMFFLLISSAIINMIYSNFSPINWGNFVSKWSVTVAIGAAVTYCARQASKLEKVERENRSMELQMATIDPYLEVFSEDERKEIKKLLVDRIFTGQTTTVDSYDSKSININDVSKLISAVSEVSKSK